MLRPTPGELLAGVRRELAEQVLPEVASGAAARQLRAALHVLAQLERCWDLMPSYLAADNADLRASLAELAALTGVAPAPRPVTVAPTPGVQDPALRSLIEDNDRLQADLGDVQRAWRARGGADQPDPTAVDTLLFALHSRMAERARAATGLPPTDPAED